MATLGFGVLFNIRGKKLVIGALAGGIAWFAYLMFYKLTHSDITSFFLATILAASYAEIMARIFKTPVTSFVICAIIPLVPGGGMYYTVLKVIRGNITDALSSGIKTIGIAGAIAVGIFFVSMIFKIIGERHTAKDDQIAGA
jgi:Uncharacterized conserved protein